MKCPKCGAENAAGAKFCRDCGAPQAGAVAGGAPQVGAVATGAGRQAPAGAPQEGATRANAGQQTPSGAPQAGARQQAAPVRPAAPAQQTSAAPHAHGAASHAAAPGTADVKAKAGELLGKFKALPKKTQYAVGGVAAVIIIALVAFVVTANGGPSKSQVEQDVRAAGLTDYKGGDFGNDGQLTIDSVKITNEEKEAVPQYFTDWTGVKGDAYSYDVEVKMSNDDVEVTKVVGIGYVKYQGKWESVGGASEQSATYTAKHGPTDDAIASKAESLLYSAAGTSVFDGNSITKIYDDATYSVSSNDLNGNSATVVVHCSADKPFWTAEGDLTANFSFDTSTGKWKADKVTSSDGMANKDYSKLVGTWTGKFKEQEKGGSSGKCLAGSKQDLKVTITSVDNTTKKVEGKFSGNVHYHDKTDNDVDSVDGDTYVTDQPFSFTLKDYYSAGYNLGGISGSLGGTYEVPQTTDGDLTIAMGFGSSSGAEDQAATCLRTEPAAGGVDFFGDHNVNYQDVYTLTKDA